MIRVKIDISEHGCIAGCSSSGHSSHSFQGNKSVCTAVSTLVRTLSRMLFIESDIRIEGNAPGEGSLFFTILHVPETRTEWLKGVSDFFIRGIEDLQSEYPDDVYMEIVRKK